MKEFLNIIKFSGEKEWHHAREMRASERKQIITIGVIALVLFVIFFWYSCWRISRARTGPITGQAPQTTCGQQITASDFSSKLPPTFFIS